MYSPFLAAFKTAIRIQCFVSLIALPLQSMWGLPISLLGPLGNILFNPVLVLFLSCAFLVFFLEIFSFPNGVFIALLEYLWSGWHMALAMGSPTALCAVPALPTWLLCLVGVLTLTIAHLRLPRWWMQPLLWTLLGAAVICYGFWRLPREQKFEAPCGHARINIHQKADGRCIAFDYGDRGSQPDSWVQYPLAKILAQRCGTKRIATYVILRSSPAAWRRALILSTANSISTIVCAANPYTTRELWQLRIAAAVYGVGVVVVRGTCVIEGYTLCARKKGNLELVA